MAVIRTQNLTHPGSCNYPFRCVWKLTGIQLSSRVRIESINLQHDNTCKTRTEPLDVFFPKWMLNISLAKHTNRVSHNLTQNGCSSPPSKQKPLAEQITRVAMSPRIQWHFLLQNIQYSFLYIFKMCHKNILFIHLCTVIPF